MRFKVNEGCIGCGMCVGICPGVFSIGPDGTAVAAESGTASADEGAAIQALSGCPVSVIEKIE